MLSAAILGDSYVSGEAGRWAGNSNTSSTYADARAAAGTGLVGGEPKMALRQGVAITLLSGISGWPGW